MKHQFVKSAVIVIFLGSFCGCGRIVDWAEDSFDQGKDLNNYSKVPRLYVRSVSVYDQFETRGMFDGLLLADPVRKAYVNLCMLKHGKTEEQKNVFLRRQLEENNYFITFYILSLYEKPLNGADTDWSLFLEIDGEIFAPIEIKAVELGPEFSLFFGKQFSRFKVPYVVKFNARDIDNNLLISNKTKTIALYFRSVNKQVSLVWQFRDGRLVINDK